MSDPLTCNHRKGEPHKDALACRSCIKKWLVDAKGRGRYKGYLQGFEEGRWRGREDIREILRKRKLSSRSLYSTAAYKEIFGEDDQI